MAAADLAEDAADEAEAAEMAAQQTDDVEVQEGAEYVANDAAQRVRLKSLRKHPVACTAARTTYLG